MRLIENIQINDLVVLREFGCSYDEIARQSGISKSSVFRRLSSAASAALSRKPIDCIPADQQEKCRLDPAWEFRQKLAARVVCRECGEVKKSALNRPDGGHLAKRHGLSCGAYLSRYPGAPLCPRKLVPCLSLEELDDCRLDPAWEARQKIADQIACRECGQLVRIRLTSHLRAEHGMSSEEYLKKWPCSRLCSFDQSEKANKRSTSSWVRRKRSAAELMQRMAADFVNAVERRGCMADPMWEEHHGIKSLIVCRRCGFKSRCAMTAHLKTHYGTRETLRHGEMTAAYHADYPGAPTAAPPDSPNRRALNVAYERRKLRDQRLRSRKKPGPQTPSQIGPMVAELKSAGHTWPQIKRILDRKTGTYRSDQAYRMARYRFLAHQ